MCCGDTDTTSVQTAQRSGTYKKIQILQSATSHGGGARDALLPRAPPGQPPPPAAKVPMIFHLNVAEGLRELFRNLDSGIWTKVCVPNRGKDGTFDSKGTKPVERPVSDPLHQSTRRPQSMCVCVCVCGWVGVHACMRVYLCVAPCSDGNYMHHACMHFMCMQVLLSSMHVHVHICIPHEGKPHAQNKYA